MDRLQVQHQIILQNLQQCIACQVQSTGIEGTALGFLQFVEFDVNVQSDKVKNIYH